MRNILWTPMGQKHSIGNDHWSSRLNFGSKSIANNVLTCEELRLEYRLETLGRSLGTSKRVTSIFRCEVGSEQGLLIAEVEGRGFNFERVRIAYGLGATEGFIPLERFAKMKPGWPSDKLSFVACNGGYYTWKITPDSLKLYQQGDELPIAASGNSIFGSRRKNFKLAHNCAEILDDIVVTLLVAEKHRRKMNEEDMIDDAIEEITSHISRRSTREAS